MGRPCRADVDLLPASFVREEAPPARRRRPHPACSTATWGATELRLVLPGYRRRLIEKREQEGLEIDIAQHTVNVADVRSEIMASHLLTQRTADRPSLGLDTALHPLRRRLLPRHPAADEKDRGRAERNGACERQCGVLLHRLARGSGRALGRTLRLIDQAERLFTEVALGATGLAVRRRTPHGMIGGGLHPRIFHLVRSTTFSQQGSGAHDPEK